MSIQTKENNGQSSLVSTASGSAADNFGLTPTLGVEVSESTLKIDQRVPIVELARAAPPVHTDALEYSMPDKNWTASSLLDKPVVLSRFQWAASSATHVSLCDIAIPEVLNSLPNLQKQALTIWAFYRPDFEIEIEINSNEFMSGRAVFCLNPYNRYQFDTQLQAFQACQLPSAQIDASNSSKIHFKIPYTSIQSYFTTVGAGTDDDLVHLRGFVLNQLQAVQQQVANVEIVVWLKSVSASLHVPIYPHTPSLFMSSDIPSEPQIFGEISNIINSVTGAIGDVMSGNIGGAIEKGMNAAGTILPFFGLFDRPLEEKQDICNKLVTVPGLTHGVGLDGSTKLAINPATKTLHDTTVVGIDQDQMNLSLMFRKFGYTNTVSWATTSSGFLTGIQVGPHLATSFSSSSPSRFIYAPPWLTYASAPFTYWRGGIEYKFDFIASKYHTGRLLFAFFPNLLLSSPDITLDNAYSVPNIEVDLHQSKEVVFTVPFVSPVPWKAIYHTWSVSGGVNNEARTTGVLAVFVLNSLRGNNQVASTVPINIYYRGADDFEVAVPDVPGVLWKDNTSLLGPMSDLIPVSLTLDSDIPSVPQGLQDITQQSAPSDRDTTLDSNRLSSSQSSVAIVSELIHGEPFRDLRSLLRRFNQVYSFDVNMTTNKSQIYYLANTPISYNLQNTYSAQSGDMLSWFSQLFAFWRGSIRYKIIVNSPFDSTDVLKVIYTPQVAAYQPLAVDTFVTNNGFDRMDRSGKNNAIYYAALSRQSAIEIDVPFYTRFMNCYVPKAQITEPPISEVGVLESAAGTLVLDFVGDSSKHRVDIYKAAGEDTLLHFMTAPPLVVSRR